MRASRLSVTRYVFGFSIFFVSALLNFGLAHGAQTIPVHVYSAAEQRLMESARVNVEQQYPRGSRVYYYDYYQIDDGPDSLSVTVDTVFHRDSSGVLYVTDVNSGYTWTFSRHATIERKNNVAEKILRPGESPTAIFLQLIKIGGARFVKVDR